MEQVLKLSWIFLRILANLVVLSFLSTTFLYKKGGTKKKICPPNFVFYTKINIKYLKVALEPLLQFLISLTLEGPVSYNWFLTKTCKLRQHCTATFIRTMILWTFAFAKCVIPIMRSSFHALTECLYFKVNTRTWLKYTKQAFSTHYPITTHLYLLFTL